MAKGNLKFTVGQLNMTHNFLVEGDWDNLYVRQDINASPIGYNGVIDPYSVTDKDSFIYWLKYGISQAEEYRANHHHNLIYPIDQNCVVVDNFIKDGNKIQCMLTINALVWWLDLTEVKPTNIKSVGYFPNQKEPFYENDGTINNEINSMLRLGKLQMQTLDLDFTSKYTASDFPNHSGALPVTDKSDVYIYNIQKQESILNKVKRRNPFTRSLHIVNSTASSLEFFNDFSNFADVTISLVNTNVVDFNPNLNQPIAGIFYIILRNNMLMNSVNIANTFGETSVLIEAENTVPKLPVNNFNINAKLSELQCKRVGGTVIPDFSKIMTGMGKLIKLIWFLECDFTAQSYIDAENNWLSSVPNLSYPCTILFVNNVAQPHTSFVNTLKSKNFNVYINGIQQ